MYNGAKAAECAFCISLIIGISSIEQNAKICLAANLVTGAQRSVWAYVQRRRAKSGVQKHSVCCYRGSGSFIVSIQQTACSALARGFEPRSAPDSMCTKARKHVYKSFPNGAMYKICRFCSAKAALFAD